MKKEERLRGFDVYRLDDGWRSDDDFAMTDDGQLLRKTSTGYMDVPHRGEYIVECAGKLEVW